MTTRRHFMQGSAIASAGLLAAQSALAAESEPAKPLDSITDASGQYVLAPLPYTYDALELVIDARTVELHYQFHHKPAVAAANKAEQALAAARESGDYYLKYQNRRGEYLGKLFDIVNWDRVSERYDAARR